MLSSSSLCPRMICSFACDDRQVLSDVNDMYVCDLAKYTKYDYESMSYSVNHNSLRLVLLMWKIIFCIGVDFRYFLGVRFSMSECSIRFVRKFAF